MFISVMAFIVLSAGMVWFLLAHDHGKKEPAGALWAAAGFGLLAVLGAIFLEKLILPQNLLGGSLPTSELAASAFGVGVIEEGLKFLPLAFFIYKKPYFNENVDGIIYFAVAGLTFGLLENISYTLGTQSSRVAIGRLILVPFFHCAVTALVGYFLIRTKLENKSPLSMALPLLAAVCLHALYDFGLLSATLGLVLVSLMITLAMDMGLVLVFISAKDHDKAEGLSVDKFCQACGRPNINHTIFCEYCGQKT